jgi:transposase
VWNWSIKKIEHNAQDKIYFSAFDFVNLLSDHGKKLGIPSHTIQGVLSQAYTAWSRCFKKIGGKPKLKGQRNKLNSVVFPDRIHPPKENHISIPGIGKIRYHKQMLPKGNIKCGRIIKRASGWYLCLFIDAERAAIIRTGYGKIGIDPGFKSLLTLARIERLTIPSPSTILQVCHTKTPMLNESIFTNTMKLIVKNLADGHKNTIADLTQKFDGRKHLFTEPKIGNSLTKQCENGGLITKNASLNIKQHIEYEDVLNAPFVAAGTMLKNMGGCRVPLQLPKLKPHSQADATTKHVEFTKKIAPADSHLTTTIKPENSGDGYVPTVMFPLETLRIPGVFYRDFWSISTEKIEHPRELEAVEKRLGQAQRGHDKQLAARLSERRANQAKDRNHKLSLRLVKENVLIAFSADNHKGIAKKFGKSVSSSGHYQLQKMLSYKSRIGGTEYREIDSRNSTKTCSSCGALTGPTGLNGLSVRRWVCSACGAVLDRDINAAINTLVGAGAAHEEGLQNVA